ncbi:amino acid synthesis family protein [Alphaproteobacteria bacterium]|nr:amino acid synthesis family protein [Alphaproteobacteria bacterium]
MQLEIRKFVTYSEEVHIEGFKKTDKPLHLFAVAAVITNPWAGRFVEDLKPEIHAFAPILGEQLTSKILKLAGGPDQIEAYGKAAVVGTEGEIEHASALTHTLRFGNFYRNAVEAKSYLVFTNTRSPANGPIMIPLMHKHDPGQRSHYHTIQFSISDAPSANEIVIALGGANGGRPHHRIGDRYQDLKELGNDVEDPAKV